jgi:hypothetical protein
MYIICYLPTGSTVVRFTGLGSAIIFIITPLRPFLFTCCFSLSMKSSRSSKIQEVTKDAFFGSVVVKIQSFEGPQVNLNFGRQKICQPNSTRYAMALEPRSPSTRSSSIHEQLYLQKPTPQRGVCWMT